MASQHLDVLRRALNDLDKSSEEHEELSKELNEITEMLNELKDTSSNYEKIITEKVGIEPEIAAIVNTKKPAANLHDYPSSWKRFGLLMLIPIFIFFWKLY